MGDECEAGAESCSLNAIQMRQEKTTETEISGKCWNCVKFHHDPANAEPEEWYRMDGTFKCHNLLMLQSAIASGNAPPGIPEKMHRNPTGCFATMYGDMQCYTDKNDPCA